MVEQSPGLRRFFYGDEDLLKSPTPARDSGFFDVAEGQAQLKPPPLPPRPPATAKRTPSNAVKIDPVLEQENIYASLENAISYGARKPKTATESSLRAFLLDELIDNETKFKKEMVLILSLLSSGDTDVPISVEDFMSIFINLPDYVSVSNEIINAFTNVKKNSIDPELTCVAGAFLPIIPLFKKAYVDYIKHFDPQLVQKRPHLEKYFKVASAMLTKEDNNNSSLSDRLLTPFQRPFKISNVFERMKKCTPKGHPDHENLTMVLHQMQDLIATADRIKRPGSEYATSTEITPASSEANSLNELTIKSTEDWYNSRLTNYRWRWEKINCFLDNLCKQLPDITESLIAYVKSRRNMLKTVEQFTQALKLKNGAMQLTISHLKRAGLDKKSEAHKKLRVVSEDIVETLTRLAQFLKKKPIEPTKKLESANKHYQELKKSKSFKGTFKPTDERIVMDYIRRKELLAVSFCTLLQNATDIVHACLLKYGLAVQEALASTTFPSTDIYQVVFQLPGNPESLTEQIKTEAQQCISKVFNYDVPLPPPKPLPQYRVTNLYSGSSIKHIMVGQVVRVLQTSDGKGSRESWLIKTSNGETGFYPASYLAPLS